MKQENKGLTTRQVTQLMVSLKSVPCHDCGGAFPPVCMQFDHVPERGPKVASVCGIKDEALLLQEAAKCDVVCANCHAIRTSSRPWTEERRRRSSEAQKRVQKEIQNRPEVKAKIAASRVGFIFSDEARARMRESQRRRWERVRKAKLAAGSD